VGWVEMTPPSPTLTPPLPPANENCLPRKEPVNPLPVPLPLPVPGPALLGTLPGPLLVSLAVLPRFLLAISYMSPKIPAKVFLRFFMVSSASSTTELWVCGGLWPTRDTEEEMVEACEVCESRRTPPTVLGPEDNIWLTH